MPRIPTRLILQAYQHDTILPLLLRECRTLESAKNELRWLREHALRVSESTTTERVPTKAPVPYSRALLRTMCAARSRGVPLQYILGDQPFGDLDIKCKRGVLIPRHETETITYHAANLILQDMANGLFGDNNEKTPLRILDLCTGSGCIPLLLHSLLAPHIKNLSITGIDISSAAVRLAEENHERNVHLGLLSDRALEEISFRQGNVLDYAHDLSALANVLHMPAGRTPDLELGCDVIISNPPYISPVDYRNGTTSRSVRMFEPKPALVPPESYSGPMLHVDDFRIEDLFYHHIAAIVASSRARLAVLECGDRLQAMRVASLCTKILQGSGEPSRAAVDIWSVSGIDTHPCAVFIHLS
ncbi:S-adenosyl-L-methionine-dependent methyltransferase [Aspergillus pseudodeflectus]|uniref:S-adenosyl-L-methionine-dependent methyltransferase n=1 Tax=Aspergillus pseudodeflectus TaxID=176178 RepID=A0ABR4JBD3_9EURO